MRAMIDEMNKLPGIRLPLDSGIDAGHLTGPIDYVIEGGDIANRMEIPDQSDAASWTQFCSDYINRINAYRSFWKKNQAFNGPG